MNEMNKAVRWLIVLTLLLAGLLPTGCGDSSSQPAATSGAVTLSLTDAPVDDCSHVVLGITKLIFLVGGETEVIPLAEEGTGEIAVVFDPPVTVELSALSGGLSFPLLAGYQVPAGTYDLIRVLLDPATSSVTVGTGLEAATYPLTAAASYQGAPSLLWIGSFTVAADAPLDLTIDYDLRRSLIYQPGSGNYLLKPHYRIVDTETSASLYGYVDATLATGRGCDGFVYLLAGAGNVPDDYDGDDAALIGSMRIDQATGGFQFGFLPSGDYTLAFTCDGSTDEPEAEDELTFIASKDVTLTGTGTVRVDLAPEDKGRPDGEPEETAGNNLAMPLIWSDGITKLLPGVFDAPVFEGSYWWYWLGEGDLPVVCEPGVDCPDPLPAEAVQVFVQQDAGNSWQAETLTPEESLNVTQIDWGDNLESRAWSANSIVRTEVVLYQDVSAAPMDSFEMLHLYGTGVGEMWGTTGSVVESPEALVYSGCARLTIQKLTKTRDDPTLSLTWDAATSRWTGDVGAPLFNEAVWEAGDGPGYYSSEISVSGKMVYGYNWNVRNEGDGPGDYRLTFSLDDDTCPGTLNTFFTEGMTTIRIPVEEETTAVIPAAEDGSDNEGGITAIDFANNLTFIDVRILSRSGGGGGGPGGGGRP